MAWAGSLLAVLLLVLCSSSSLAKLTGGKFKGIQMTLQPSQEEEIFDSYFSLVLEPDPQKNQKEVLRASLQSSKEVQMVLTVYKVKCANFELDNYCGKEFLENSDPSLIPEITRLASNTLKQPLEDHGSDRFNFTFHPNATKYFEAPTTSTPPTTAAPTTAAPTTAAPTTAAPTTAASTTATPNTAASTTATPTTQKVGGSARKERAVVVEGQDKRKQSRDLPIPLFNISEDAIYFVHFTANLSSSKPPNMTVTISFDLEMKTPFGFLSAVDYPALVFYSIMMAVYGIYGILWIVLMACSYKDLVRLQFWIGAVIILGFLEKTFFVSEYSSVNLGNDSSGLNIVAEGVSAAKRALARMLLIIVSLGFGTVKPRLGDSLGKVVAAGVIYFVFALIDGIVRTRSNTSSTSDTSSLVTLALLLFLDVIIFYWIFSSLVATRRALRLRKNYVKLSLYNHFTYTLIFAILATIGFLIWVFLDLNYPHDDCLTDWKEVWLRECYWHILFAFILGIVMILWRPSSNRIRFAYSLVTDHDEDQEEPEQENKNFETVKMRTVTKPGSETPVVTSAQAEDDLRWVEENLPTTAVDKALPFVLDSDEEVMTTRFEMSKMN